MWDKTTKWDTVIRPMKGWVNLNVKELIRFRDLIMLLVKRNFKVLYKQTVLGPIWVIIQPLLTTIVFTVIFGGIAKLPTDGMPSFLFYMAGNIAWQYFASCLTQTSSTFIQNRQLFGKIYFPRLVMPISTVMTQLINFLVQFAMFLVFLVYYATRANPGVHPDFLMMLYTPVLLIQMAALGLGFGIIVSALTTKYRDLSMLVNFGVHLWMYASPIAYSSSLIAKNYPNLMGVYMINPMAPMIELFRAAFLGIPMSGMEYYWISWAVTAVVLFMGIILFTRVEKTFMDTV